MNKDKSMFNVPVLFGQHDGDTIYIQLGEDGRRVAKYTVESNIIKKIEWLYWDEWNNTDWLKCANEEKIFVLPILSRGALIGDGAFGDLQNATVINLNEELRLDRECMTKGGVVSVITKDNSDKLLSEEVLIEGNIDPFECWKVFYIGHSLVPNTKKLNGGAYELVYGEVKDNDSLNMREYRENPNPGIRIVVDKSREINIDEKTGKIVLLADESQM